MEVKGRFVKVISREQIKRKDGTLVVDKGGRVMEKMVFLLQLPSSNKEKFLAIETINTVLMNYISDTRSGTEVVVQCLAESREWQGRWFTSVVATDVQTERNTAKDDGFVFDKEDDEPLPF